MRISVVIPTYNRSDILQQCLAALFVQDFSKKNYEIIVVDDGSRDETAEVVKKMQKNAPVPLKFLQQTNQGQGSARNKGIDEATGDIILLIGDDIIAAKTLLSEHARMHQLRPAEYEAVLGFVTWDPVIPITPLMRFMERGGAILGRWGGHQFAYDLLEGRDRADYRFFYTANISLKRTLLQKQKFDPWFSGYGFEDIELGYRMTKQAGLILYYASDAVGFHRHAMSFENFANRMRAIGRASTSLHHRYPELGVVPTARKKRIFQLMSNPISLQFFKALNQNLYFYALSKKYFLEGLKEGYTESIL